MNGHDLGGLPVVEGGKLVGMVLHKHLLGIDAQRRVEEIMDSQIPAVSLATNLHEVADTMAEYRTDLLTVLDEAGEMLGVVAQSDLLRELRHALDPLTGLPWSDSLRSWAIEQLRASREITLLFIDVNDFGIFNKRHGHVVGDSILHDIACILREATDPSRDMLCRYGGDEFCIASLRKASEAAILAEEIGREVARLSLLSVENEKVDITVGLCGGRRTHEREQSHYMAMLNNLINLASKDCLAKKQARIPSAVEEKSPAGSPELAVVSADLVFSEDTATLVKTSAPIGTPFTIILTQSGQTAHVHLGWQPKS